MKIPLGGFDLTQDIIDGIEKGTITATVDQQPYSQGFYAVAQLALYLKYGLYPSDMNTGGLGLVDKTNVAKVKALVRRQAAVSRQSTEHAPAAPLCGVMLKPVIHAMLWSKRP